MAVSSSEFKLIRKEKDPKFDIEFLEHYNLLLQLGFSDMQVCVTDSRSNRIMLLEDYVMPGVNTQEERVECLEYLFDDHHLLLAGFWNEVRVLVKNRKFSLVPEKLFEKKNVQEYVRINSHIENGHENYLYNHYRSLGLINAFAINRQVTDFLVKKTYPTKKVKFFHQSSVFINGFREYFKGRKGRILSLYLDRFVIHITVFMDGKFHFYNQYAIRKFDDYIKYVGFVTKEFEIHPEHDHFYIWGFLGKDSKHFKILKENYPSLQFGGRPTDLQLGFVFDEIPEHQFFDLLSFNFLS